MTLAKKPIVVALDFPDDSEALNLAKRLDPDLCRVKVGKELFTRSGPQVVKELNQMGFDVFLDLKYHDIPSTVAKAVLAAKELGCWMINVHASGGLEMMKQARAALDHHSGGHSDTKPLLIAVTVLTSMAESDAQEIGIQRPLNEQVLYLAGMAKQAGLDGVVCSAQEAAAIKQHCGEHFITVTPGIRLEGDATGDQKRVLTPVKAIQSGSDILVIGRSITGSTTPSDVLSTIQNEVVTARQSI